MILRKVTALEERILAQVRTWAERHAAWVEQCESCEYTAASVFEAKRLERGAAEARLCVLRLGKQYAKAKKKCA